MLSSSLVSSQDFIKSGNFLATDTFYFSLLIRDKCVIYVFLQSRFVTMSNVKSAIQVGGVSGANG